MALAIKIAGITLGGASAVGGAGTAIYFATRGTLISDLLKEDGKVLNTDKEWLAAWTKYLGTDEKQNKWELKGELKKTTVNPKFKEECKRRLNLRVSSKEDQDYKDIIEWCAKAQ